MRKASRGLLVKVKRERVEYVKKRDILDHYQAG